MNHKATILEAATVAVMTLKSEHLWQMVEDFTKEREEEYDEEDNVINGNSIPDWVARAMLYDLKTLRAMLAEMEANDATT